LISLLGTTANNIALLTPYSNVEFERGHESIVIQENSCNTFSLLLISSVSVFDVASATRGFVSINFDDGFQSQYDYAFPLLQARGIPATFYVIPGRIGAARYLTVSELQTLQNAGNEIDSHTANHYDLPSLSYADMVYQLQVSQQSLRSWGLTANNLAYPDAVRTDYTDSIVHNYYRSARGDTFRLSRYSYQHHNFICRLSREIMVTQMICLPLKLLLTMRLIRIVGLILSFIT